MKAATVSEIKKELKLCSRDEAINYCLRLARFKKENKELLTYLLFESSDEERYVTNIKIEVEQLFSEINTNSYYYVKKSVRKILRRIKTYSRYSLKKETEVELTLHFCQELKTMRPTFKNNIALVNLYKRQILAMRKLISALHEDLQYDYSLILDDLDI